jgi:ribonuclease HII
MRYDFMHQNTHRYIAGVDEAGRGPLAGPVIAAAVILSADLPAQYFFDSKKLTPKKRETLSHKVQCEALAWAIGQANVDEIDQYNILNASLLAMQRAAYQLTVIPDHIYVDGRDQPEWPFSSESVIKGDQAIAEISAASILAKVYRDQLMVKYDGWFPGYGFAQHKGYPSKMHLHQLEKRGASAIHRRSFKPVQKIGNRKASVN